MSEQPKQLWVSLHSNGIHALGYVDPLDDHKELLNLQPYYHRDVVLAAMATTFENAVHRTLPGFNEPFRKLEEILDRELEGKQTLPASGTSKGELTNE